MGHEDNKDVARRGLEGVWSASEGVPAEDVYAADFVSHQHSHPSVDDVTGLAALQSFIGEFHQAFPDFTDRVDLQVAEGDLVATQFTSSGTHEGTIFGVAPTGRRVEWSGIEIARVVDGRIVENWVSWDMYGMLQQLGASPMMRARDTGA